VVVLPQGHPLRAFIGTQYQSALTDYLGPTILGGANQGAVCNIHGPESLQQIPQWVDDPNAAQSLTQDALALLTAASQQRDSLDSGHPGYLELFSAIDALSQMLAANPGFNELVNAMARLTQAMANAQ
jgi:hypothetical protein